MVPFQYFVSTAVLLQAVMVSSVSANCYECILENTVLECSSIRISDTDQIDFGCFNFTSQQKSSLTQLVISNSTIPWLNLSFVSDNGFTGLSEIRVYNSAINATGSIPCHLRKLLLAKNEIRNISGLFASNHENDTNGDENYSNMRMTECASQDFTLDVTNNSIEELPIEMLSYYRLKSIYLAGNPLKCEFIWETLWDHLECQRRNSGCKRLLADHHLSTCQFYKQKLVNSSLFHYNVSNILDAKIVLERECSEMNKTCECHPFNLLRDTEGKLTAYLTLNCSHKNLTQLPRVSNYTWELNASSNYISCLDNLNETWFPKLRRLDITHNWIADLSSITESSFMKDFDMLNISSNRISYVTSTTPIILNLGGVFCIVHINDLLLKKIPDAFLANLKLANGTAAIKIGTTLNCDCHTSTQTKGKLIEMQNHIVDANDIVCGNFPLIRSETDEHSSSSGSFLKVKDLKLADVCYISHTDSETSNYIVWICVIETFFITAIVIKVAYDWKVYQRTGILPYISQKLPRLPCDGMLDV